MNRRDYVKAAGLAGVTMTTASLAGCTGEVEDEEATETAPGASRQSLAEEVGSPPRVGATGESIARAIEWQNEAIYALLQEADE